MPKLPISNSSSTNDQGLGDLDSAVNELSKQTDQLLGSIQSKPNAPKPTLPKKQASVQNRARSFDIIHQPKQGTTKLESTLKTAPKLKPQKLLDAAEPVEKLAVETELALPAEASADKEEVVVEDKTLAVAVEEPKLEVQHSPEDTTESQMAVPEAIMQKMEDPIEVTPQSSANENPVPSPRIKPSAPSVELALKDSTEQTEAPQIQSEITNKPTVFDTDQYHPELHHWSPPVQSSSNKSLWIVVLIAVLVVAAIVAFLATNN